MFVFIRNSAVTPAPRLHTLPPLRITSISRLFSLTHVNHTPSKDPDARRRALDSENEWHRHDYAKHPEWRQKRAAQATAYQKHRWLHDPEWRERQLARNRAFLTLNYARPEYRTARIERSKRYQRLALETQPHAAPMMRLGRFLRRYPWLAEEASWTTHTPILYPEKVKHFCTGCACERHDGLLLWWRRKSDPTLYDCHACFVKYAPEIMPQGYEDVTTAKQLHKRREELGLLKAKTTPAERPATRGKSSGSKGTG